MALRRDAERSVGKLMEFLLVGEQEREEVWQAHGSFVAFLRNTGIVDAAIYEKYKRARAVLGYEVVERIGAHGAIAAACASEDAMPRVVTALAAWHDEKGAPASDRTAKHIVSQLDPRIVIPRVLKSRETIDGLRREVAALRARVGQLETENERLRAAESARGARSPVASAGAAL